MCSPHRSPGIIRTEATRIRRTAALTCSGRTAAELTRAVMPQRRSPREIRRLTQPTQGGSMRRIRVLGAALGVALAIALASASGASASNSTTCTNAILQGVSSNLADSALQLGNGNEGIGGTYYHSSFLETCGFRPVH